MMMMMESVKAQQELLVQDFPYEKQLWEYKQNAEGFGFFVVALYNQQVYTAVGHLHKLLWFRQYTLKLGGFVKDA